MTFSILVTGPAEEELLDAAKIWRQDMLIRS